MSSILYLLILSLISGVVLGGNTPPDSATTSRVNFSQSGFLIGLPIQYERLPEGKYVPILLQGNLDFRIKKASALEEKNSRFYFYLEPTVNPVMIPDTTSSIEMGGSVGFKYGYYFNPNNSLKIHAGIGGQYHHLESAVQAQGYIFAHNAGLSYQRNLKGGKLYTTVGYRYRHLSNYGIKQPNTGIGNHFVLFGIGRLR